MNTCFFDKSPSKDTTWPYTIKCEHCRAVNKCDTLIKECPTCSLKFTHYQPVTKDKLQLEPKPRL